MNDNLVNTNGSIAVILTPPATVHVVAPTSGKVSAVNRKIEDAVYQYIRAKRILGQVRINTASIADALDLPHASVSRAVKGLAKKGVKVLG